jgi:carbamoyl-phosphate synthase / aspartate carbamoyltransferase
VVGHQTVGEKILDFLQDSLPQLTPTALYPSFNSFNSTIMGEAESQRMALELEDGSVSHGFAFGADKSVAGELVFQTGMVGYPESITDPSYRGQILVMTFPLVGNYGVPAREARDRLLEDLPAHFEADQIHISGLVVASYAEEEYSHHLATSSLGQWLKEQGVPAIFGVDTRALTKKIREKGSMLGKLLREKNSANGAIANGIAAAKFLVGGTQDEDWKSSFEDVAWSNPNEKNLVAEGRSTSHQKT